MAALLAACGDPQPDERGTGGSPLGTIEQAYSAGCDLIGYEALVKNVAPDVPVDYVELRSERRDDAAWTVETLASRGVSCATAADRSACAERVAAVRTLTDVCNGQRCNDAYYVATRGDGIVVAKERSEIRDLIGRVDRPAEAIAVATFLGRYPAVCVDEAPTRYRALGAGYELQLGDYGCTEQGEQLTFRVTVRVDPDGAVHELSRVEVARKRLEGACVSMPTEG